MPRLFALTALLLVAACARPAEDPKAGERAILGVIAKMEAAWNRGDFKAYMSAFRNPGIVFVSCGREQKNWQATLDHYIRNYGGAPRQRGRLHFFDVRVEMLSPDAAQLVSRYRLDRPVDPQDGINTRLMRKIGARWVIALNHVSSRGGCAPAKKP
jgi:hypothetical protein